MAQHAAYAHHGELRSLASLSQPASAVDIWSGNHPFFQGNTSTVVTDEGRVNRFKRRFAGDKASSCRQHCSIACWAVPSNNGMSVGCSAFSRCKEYAPYRR